MNKSTKIIYAILVSLLLVVWGFYFFKRNEDGVPKKISAYTSISVEKRIRNLGRVELHKPVTTSFEIVNSGNKPLIIYNIDVDCKCTIPDWDKSPIPPKSSTTVNMTYDSHATGFFSKKAVIKYNSSEGDFVIMIQGEVI